MADACRPRGSVAWTFVLLGPTLTMAFAMAEAAIRSATIPGDVSFVILAFLVGSDPLALLMPWLLLMLPFGLTGLIAFKLEGRTKSATFVTACTAVGATLGLLCAPLFGAKPDLYMVVQSALAAFTCALLAKIRISHHRSDFLPRP
ncbi:hypothetical protein CA606_08380 [Caulobacter vibrioides]|uniref:Uncharacterized protein n=1 Tax=Caulobacter vibrioides TaxID=155892 RepID=A0A290MTU4_CAUVI|nr:hypothetical protein [Caulobacter vibrioides]ATC32367.1 hypothetical protein CA606_08380 [Caulobacter vibrioides]